MEVSELFDYLHDHPTAAEILAAVYEVKPKFSRKMMDDARGILGPKKEVDERAFNEVVPFFGGMPSGIPDEVRESIKYANEMKKKLKIN